MKLSNLGSGSAGNSSLLTINGRHMLIDAGLGPRTIANRLKGTNVTVDQINAIVLTHPDQDHIKSSWTNTALRYGIPIYCHQRHLALTGNVLRQSAKTNAYEQLNRQLLKTYDDQPFEIILGHSPIALTPIHLPHDEHGSYAFLIRSRHHRIGYATDLGNVTEPLKQQFVDLDLLAVEANYDPAMQEASDRPWFLKQRITNGQGHLSNQQALDLVLHICNQSRQLPQHIVLLHLSRQCNCPRIVRQLFMQYPRIADRLQITCQQQRSQTLSLTTMTTESARF